MGMGASVGVGDGVTVGRDAAVGTAGCGRALHPTASRMRSKMGSAFRFAITALLKQHIPGS
jgi:hypothetical protein